MVAAPTVELPMARTSANNIGPFSINTLVSMVSTHIGALTNDHSNNELLYRAIDIVISNRPPLSIV
jgi:hypothetical protein